MPQSILVLCGPLLTKKVAELEDSLRETARDATLVVLQSNHEGVLLDALEERAYDGVLVIPGPAAANLRTLGVALSLCGKPTAEALFEKPKTPSALSCKWRRVGSAAAADALEALLRGVDDPAVPVAHFERSEPATDPFVPITSPPRPPKSIGRAAEHAEVRPQKTLGPRAPSSPGRAEAEVLTRASVRSKLAERLSDTLSADGLMAWAREQIGAESTEVAHRELIDEVLLLLAASTKHSDGDIVAFMAKLDG
jgi:3-dehydroquinate dehydratase II